MSQRRVCPMCHFEVPTMALCLSHLRLVNGSDPRFCVQCGIDGCSYSGRSFSALYTHIYRNHPHCGVIHKGGRGTTRSTRLDLQQPNDDATRSTELQIALSDNNAGGLENELQGFLMFL